MQSTTRDNSRIRPIGANDAQHMVDFFESFSEQTRIFFTPHDIMPADLEKLVREIPEHSDAVRFMLSLEENGLEIMIGYVFFWDWDRLIPWFGIGLRDAYHSQGLGSWMMEFAIDFARKNGKGGILLITQKPNTKAQGLYRKYGFELLGEHISGEYMLILRFEDPAQLKGSEK